MKYKLAFTQAKVNLTSLGRAHILKQVRQRAKRFGFFQLKDADIANEEKVVCK